MRRGELASLVTELLGPRHVVICGLGSTTYAWKATGSQIPAFYAADPMGLAPGLALGFALASQDREVVLLEGDGDLIMNLGVLVTMADTAAGNLRTIVFHNGRYETGGNKPIPAVGRMRLAGIAEAAGFAWTAQYDWGASAEEVAAAVSELLQAPTPALLVVGIDAEHAPYGGPGDYSGAEERAEFQRRIAAVTPPQSTPELSRTDHPASPAPAASARWRRTKTPPGGGNSDTAALSSEIF